VGRGDGASEAMACIGKCGVRLESKLSPLCRLLFCTNCIVDFVRVSRVVLSLEVCCFTTKVWPRMEHLTLAVFGEVLTIVKA
jgi:hypothetical protein